MEKKKEIFQNQHTNLQQTNEVSVTETFVRPTDRQISQSDHLQRNTQYGLKPPNYLVQQVNPNFQSVQYENQYRVYQSPDGFNNINLVSHPLHVQDYNQYRKRAPPLYGTTQVPPQSSLSNNVVVQNTPQIWVPQQPLVIPYQPQRIQKPEQKTNVAQIQNVPAKSSSEKKKIIGSSQQKNLTAKRPPEAPVTKQGWLHKQGSEGLMLWKKRWFVLVEYCLFYYKGPEEEKLLGSILLPSYKVSICKPEEKISKKFAFKCEHANMRTYILATDSQEQMMHWVQVLNLASVMQKHTDPPKATSNYDFTKQQLMDSYDESSKRQYSESPLNFSTPLNTHSPSNSLLQDQCAYNQPLYANAPPKPRRLNDGFSSPSPDNLDRQNAHYVDPRQLNKSPNPVYSRQISKSPNQVYSKNINYHLKHSRESLEEFDRIHDVERRTPETYGRSKLEDRPTLYEDIYAEERMFKRPLSPVAYNNLVKRNTPSPTYSSQVYPPGGHRELVQYPAPQMRKNSVNNIARPHSVDFLEYELNHKTQEPVNSQQRPRPKSSLDINITANDNDFYSKERYAEKMRKSAQYLKPTPNKYMHSNDSPVRYECVSPFVPAHPNFLNVNKSQMSYIQKPQRIRSKSALGDGQSHDVDVETRYLDREMANIDFSKQFNQYGSPDYEQFTRSASARLANQRERISAEMRNIHRRDGERKREESMRRLLEWKQRMLQSPLNRKIQGNVTYRGKTDIYNNNDMGYKLSKNSKYSKAYLDDYHSKTSNQYNSYSSDDEENEKSGEKLFQSQAGRILDTFASNGQSPTPAQPLSTTVLSTSTDSAKPAFHLNLHDTPYSNIIEKLLVSTNQDISNLTVTTKDLEDLSDISSKIADEIIATSTNLDSQNRAISETPVKMYNEENITVEENYMPMSPSKYHKLLESLGDNLKMDENHYVEMTLKAVGGSFLSSSFSNNQSDHHDNIQFFNDDKIEPLYMELRNPEPVNEDDFPDNMLTTPEVKLPKSDSSDADDEASKDLDSLDTPSQPRFSLSDNFRPASYYLGISRNNTDLQDSSDSELVSPPPIPSSPALLDSTECSLTNMKLKDEDNCDTNKPATNSEAESSMSVHSQRENKTQDYASLSNSKYNRTDGEKGPSYDTFFNSSHSDETFQNSNPDEAQINLDKYLIETNQWPQLYKALGSSVPENFSEYENLELTQQDDTVNKELVEEEDVLISPKTGASVSNDSISVGASATFPPISTPYYYSDLSISMTDSQTSLSTLNNQRSTLKCKRDITHIKNPIKDISLTDINSSCKLTAEARSASADFLNLTDKSGHIDDKNIYESNSIKKTAKDNNSSFLSRNLLTFAPSDKFNSADSIATDATVRRTHSLEGLLENVLKNSSVTSLITEDKDDVCKILEDASEGSYLWEEDSIWRERLRSASQRHTKSMENLDTIGEADSKRKFKSPRGITRGVTYVNENYMKADKHLPEPEGPKVAKSIDTKIRKDGSFILDREKLRQWDLMSSAPSDNQLPATVVAGQVQERNNIVVESDGNFDFDSSELVRNQQQTASGSISMNPREASQMNTFPRAVTAQKSWIPPNLPVESHSISNLSRNSEKDYRRTPSPRIYYSNQSSSHPNLTAARQENWPLNEKVSVSAGELLGRTHEELVLLLIQLRRQSSQILQAIENCYNEFDLIQAQLYSMDQAKRMENLQKLEQIKQHLIELENQYEKGKPLVNLVDNMVKLGSLYRIPSEKNNGNHHIKDLIEFNQQIQERRLMAEEKREWNRLNTNHLQFQEKVQQLYTLDRLIHEESGALQDLQQDKEDIERALVGLRQRLSKGFKDPSEVELARKEQIMLKNKLFRVHFMLAQNSKKLEETVSGNAKLEQELIILKQKLQSSVPQHSPQYSVPGDSLTCSTSTNSELESDLHKVKKKIGGLQQQRHKLSLQVRQLTDRSAVSQPKFPQNDWQNNGMNKKRIQSLWRETDLDTMSITDHGEYDGSSPIMKSSPLYINTNKKYEDYDYNQENSSSSDMNFISTTPQEKQEIKTVRIVKRESEKRQRDREKSVPLGKWDSVQEEDNSPLNQMVQTPSHFYSEDNSVPIQNLNDFEERQDEDKVNAAAQNTSPVFKSEAARQIITEIAIQQTPKQTNRRAVPKEKRRHYTAPHDQLILKSMQQLPTDDSFDKHSVNTRRARDDLDMERALRQSINAPDIVRSTLINTELKYNERTIDDLLGTPSKINIPERYIPEQLPQLTQAEQETRSRKVETIKKMLSDTTFISTSSTNLSGDGQESSKTPTKSNKPTSKMLDEKKQREHLLQLNQILAKQVMEMSKIVAGIGNSEEKQ